MPTEAEIIDALRPVRDPQLRRSIVDLGMVKEVVEADGNVRVMFALTAPSSPFKGEIDNLVTAAIEALDGVNAVRVDFTVMSPEELAAIRRQLNGDPAATAGTNQAHGHAEGRSIPFSDPSSHTRVLLIASGKGGVGKSSVSANLAVALAARGKDVGLVDADVWGFSIPRMLGITEDPSIVDSMLIPPQAHGVRAISMGFFAEEDQAVIWRGPMLHKALEQFLTDVYWDEPDFLIIDLPPGTGDVSLSLSQYLPRAEVYIVTTPQVAAQRVAQRAAAMADRVNLKVKGVIENMSWFTGDDGKRYEIFGAGGGQDLADKVGAPLLGRIPLRTNLREGSDTGRPVAAVEPDSEAGRAFAEIAERIDVELAPTRRYNKGLNLVDG